MGFAGGRRRGDPHDDVRGDWKAKLLTPVQVALTLAMDSAQAIDQPFAARLRALTAAYAAVVDESLEAVLYVDETLRIFWPRLPEAGRRRSMLRILLGLVDAGLREGSIHPATDADLTVARPAATSGSAATGSGPRAARADAPVSRATFASSVRSRVTLDLSTA